MKKYNSYLVSLNNNEMKVLLEIITNNIDGIINYYYELIFKTEIYKEKRIISKIDKYTEIDNPITYIYQNFGDFNIKDFKLSEEISNYIYTCIKNKVSEDSSSIKINYDLIEEKSNYKLKKSRRDRNYILKNKIVMPITNSVVIRNKDLFTDNKDDKNKYFIYKEAIKKVRGTK